MGGGLHRQCDCFSFMSQGAQMTPGNNNCYILLDLHNGTPVEQRHEVGSLQKRLKECGNLAKQISKKGPEKVTEENRGH